MLLFVYGTLKRGERNNGLLRQATFLRQALTQPGFTLVDFGTFPGLMRGDKAIEGELYQIDDLGQLDDFEGVGEGVYVRELIQLEDGTQAYAYLCSLSPSPPQLEGTVWYERECQITSEPLLSDAGH